MRQSAQKQLHDHLSAMLEKSLAEAVAVEVAVTCTACNGEGFTGALTNLEICPACKGQRLTVVNQIKQ